MCVCACAAWSGPAQSLRARAERPWYESGRPPRRRDHVIWHVVTAATGKGRPERPVSGCGVGGRDGCAALTPKDRPRMVLVAP